MAHDWAPDRLGRNNHSRVKELFEALRATGLECWFDNEQLTGEIVKQMTEGIDQSSTMCVCITRRYIFKVSGYGPARDDDHW
jgi:hypothetical protein